MKKILKQIIKEALREAINPVELFKFNTMVATNRALKAAPELSPDVREKIKAALLSAMKSPSPQDIAKLGVEPTTAEKVAGVFAQERKEGEEKTDQFFSNLEKGNKEASSSPFIPAARTRRVN